MIHFAAADDREWLAELREFSLLTPEVAERIDASLGRPESGTLNEFLLAGADFIDEKPWLSWLIRRHGCHRFGRVAWGEDAAALVGNEMPVEGNLPFRRCADGSLLAAVLRPDRWEAAVARFSSSRLHRAAATLREIGELHAAWRQAARR